MIRLGSEKIGVKWALKSASFFQRKNIKWQITAGRREGGQSFISHFKKYMSYVSLVTLPWPFDPSNFHQCLSRVEHLTSISHWSRTQLNAFENASTPRQEEEEDMPSMPSMALKLCSPLFPNWNQRDSLKCKKTTINIVNVFQIVWSDHLPISSSVDDSWAEQDEALLILNKIFHYTFPAKHMNFS